MDAYKQRKVSNKSKAHCFTLCVGSTNTNLEIEFGDIKQSFAAGLKALMLGSDPMVFECFNYYLLQHLRKQNDRHTHTHTLLY